MLDKDDLKLDIGGGTHKCDPSFVSVDIEGGDVTAPMWALPYNDGAVDFIYSSHTLEHSGIYRVIPTLREWFRVLKPGGGLILLVPNFDYVAQYWLTGHDRQWAEAMVFGHQVGYGEFHKCAFTTKMLRAYLEEAGFDVRTLDIIWTHSQETLRAVCVKPA